MTHTIINGDDADIDGKMSALIDTAESIGSDFRKKAERLSPLSSNFQNVRHMEAKALQDIAEAVKEGKVQSIVVPL